MAHPIFAQVVNAFRLLKAFKQNISEARVPLREAKTTPAATDSCSHKHG